MEEYNNIADENTKTRKSVTDWTQHASSISSQNLEFSKKEKPAANHHICLIIGYNEAKNEIIFSDSWGAGHEQKRMAAPDACAATMGLYLLKPAGA
jgi:hypothetical protein